MGWNHKSGAAGSAQGAGGVSFQVIAGTSFAVGDLILVAISAGATAPGQSVLSVTDQLGNTYAPLSPGGTKQYDAGNGNGSTSAVAATWVSICTMPGTPTVVVTVANATNWGWALGIDGWTSTASGVDVSATAATGAAGTTPGSNTSGATTNGDELVIAVYFDQGAGDFNQAATGYTAGAQVSGTNDNNLIIQYKDSGSIGSTLSAGNTIVGGGTPGQPWAYLLVVLQPSNVAAAETATVVDAASVSIPAGATPQVADAATVVDAAQVFVTGDAPLLPGFGSYVAPSWANWQPVAGRYTFYFARLDTNVLLMVLPLTEVSFTLLLNQAGSFSAKLPMSDRTILPDPDGAMNATLPEQTVCYIDRGGQIVGSFSVLTRNHDLATDVLQLGGQDLWYWFSKRAVTADQIYNEDMLQIQRDLVNYSQSQVNGNLGIMTDSTVNSGVTLARSYFAVTSTVAAGTGSADSGNIATACQNLANLNPGFEFRVRAHWVNGVPQRRLEQAYPHFGVPAASTQYVWSYPSGGITVMAWPEDGTRTVRQEIALGNQPTSGVRPFAISAPTPGYPLTQEVISYGVNDQTSLQNFANAQQALKANPVTLPEVTVYGPVDPKFATYQEGDHGRYVVRAGISGRFWDGMDGIWRIVGQQVTINQDGTESVKHLLSPALTS